MDFYSPGCPPEPEAIIDAVTKLCERKDSSMDIGGPNSNKETSRKKNSSMDIRGANSNQERRKYFTIIMGFKSYYIKSYYIKL